MSRTTAKKKVPKPYWESKWEVRDCATLGTYFADVYKDGELYARELDRRLAEFFVANPCMFSKAFMAELDPAKARTYLIEQDPATMLWLKQLPPDEGNDHE